jgi:hypothetical protein
MLSMPNVLDYDTIQTCRRSDAPSSCYAFRRFLGGCQRSAVRKSQNTGSSERLHPSVRFPDRLLAEARRFSEENIPFPEAEVQRAEEEARRVGGDLEQRLCTRARALPDADTMRTALRQVAKTIGLLVVAGALLAALAGAATVRAALGSPQAEPVNFYLAFGSMLGVQTIALLLWIGFSLWRPRGLHVSSFGAFALSVGQRLSHRLYTGPHHAAAIMTIGAVAAGSRIGRWVLGAISHALWLSFNAGCLIALITLLSTRHYTFGWETTILSEEAYVPLTRVISTLPDGLGFATPSSRQISQSQWTGEGPLPDQAREAWSGLLIGCSLIYGLAPRAVLLGLCLGLVEVTRRRFRLDTSLPAYARLRALLMPEAASVGVVESADETTPTARPEMPGPVEDHPTRLKGPTAILGLEIEPPATPWPPKIGDVTWNDLGFVENREDRRRVLSLLRASSSEPQTIVVVCALTTTPDRGIGTFLAELRGGSESSVELVLTGGERLRNRIGAEEVESRVEDWRNLAEEAGIDHIAEVDLDHLTDASRAKLASLVHGANSAGPPARHLEEACALIVEHSGKWSDFPTPPQQAGLHQAIAALYRHEQAPWRALLRAPTTLGSNLAASLRPSAERVVGLLPPRLRHSRTWVLAGAAAGVFGGLAAALLVTPTAIGALPLWTAVGAAIAGLVHHDATQRNDNASPPESMDYGDAVRAAALFSLLLELQGRQEAEITRLLERTVAEEEVKLDSTDAARRWLNELRHRFDVALAKETA